MAWEDDNVRNIFQIPLQHLLIVTEKNHDNILSG